MEGSVNENDGASGSGGICLPLGLAFTCSSGFFPNVANYDFLNFASTRQWTTTLDRCNVEDALPSLIETTSSNCSENLSCSACTKSTCTWCAAGMTGMLTDDANSAFTWDLLGVCIDTTDSGCDNVSFGSVLESILTEFNFGDALVSSLASVSDRCNAVEYPSYFAESGCESCIDRGETIWCSYTEGDVPEPMGGGCVHQSLSFLCENTSVANKSVTWVTDCTDAPEEPQRVSDIVIDTGHGCHDLHSYKACAANDACDWCQLHTQIKAYTHWNKEDVYWLGACRKAHSCDAVDFGTIKKLFNSGLHMTTEITASTDNQIKTAVQFPNTITFSSCGGCVATSDGSRGWCDLSIEGNLYDFELIDGYHTVLTGGICLPIGVPFLCSSLLTTTSDSIALSKKDSFWKTSLYHCASDNDDLEEEDPSDPSDSCSDNLSCSTCHSGRNCMWCGGVVEGNVFNADMSFDILGVCKEATDNGCDNISFGNLLQFILNEYEFGVRLGVSSLASDSSRCNALEYPSYYAERDCQSCINLGETIWCSFTATGDSVEPMGGSCVHESLSFLCDATSERLSTKVTWEYGCEAIPDEEAEEPDETEGDEEGIPDLDIEAHKRTIANLQWTIANKDETIAEKERIIADLQRTIANKDETIAEKERIIAEKERIIADLQDPIPDHDGAIAEKEANINEHLETITSLQRTIADNEANINDHLDTITNLQRAIDENEVTINEHLETNPTPCPQVECPSQTPCPVLPHVQTLDGGAEPTPCPQVVCPSQKPCPVLTDVQSAEAPHLDVTCKANSCQTCGDLDNCVWCNPQINVSFKEEGYTLKTSISIFVGTCQSSDTGCDAVDIPALRQDKEIRSGVIYSSAIRIDTMQQSSAICTSDISPPMPMNFNTCQECVDAKYYWCELGIKVARASENLNHPICVTDSSVCEPSLLRKMDRNLQLTLTVESTPTCQVSLNSGQTADVVAPKTDTVQKSAEAHSVKNSDAGDEETDDQENGAGAPGQLRFVGSVFSFVVASAILLL